jgi:hypothetical protein
MRSVSIVHNASATRLKTFAFVQREVILFQSFDENNSTALFDIVFGKLRSDTRLNIEAATQFVFKDDLEESGHLEHDYDFCSFQKYCMRSSE